MFGLMIRKWLGEDPEVTRFRIWCGVFVVWCISGVMSCSEIKYIRSGETAIADKINESRPTLGQPINATYQWQDRKTGDQRKKVMEIRSGFAPAQIEVQYIPGGPDSRSGSAAKWVMPMIFLGLTAAGIGAMVYMGMQDKRRVTPTSSRRRR